jgi:hypothetical protein
VLPERFRRSVPWRLGDLFLLYACTAVGLLTIGVAWYGASSSVVVSSQLRWMNVGVGGVIVLGAGILAWVLAGRRAVGALRRDLTARIAVPGDTIALESCVSAPRSDSRAERPQSEKSFVSSPGMQHYHRRGCIFAAGKQVVESTERSFRRQKRTPCRACLARAQDER